MKIPIRELCLLALAGFWCGCSRDDAERKTPPLVEVRVEAVKTADLTERIQVPGTLFPLAQAAVAAKISAPIRELRVMKGSAVKKDEVIAVLQNGDLEAARNEAQGALKEADSALARLSAGALPGELERAQAQLSTAKSALDTAEKIYERSEERRVGKECRL